MSTPKSSDDAALMAQLGAIARTIDPPPAMAYELGHSVFLLHDIDDELVELVADSEAEPSAVRTVDDLPRLLSFENDVLSIDLQISRDDHGYSILGQIEGDVECALVLLETSSSDKHPAPVDAAGRFEFSGLPRALVRLATKTASGQGVKTSWVQL